MLHNLKFDETVVSFTNAAGAGTADALYLTGTAATASSSAGGGACTCVSFRTGMHRCHYDGSGLSYHKLVNVGITC